MKNLQVIVGMGLSGVSCARYFAHKKIPFAMMDTRAEPPQAAEFKKDFPTVATVFGKLDEALLGQAQRIILSPSIALATPVIKKFQEAGVPVLGDIELFAQEITAPVIAITGTNAKSTVTTLVGKMAEAANCRVQVGGNLGYPALDLWLNDQIENRQTEVYVLELSSFQLETTYSLQPKVATILNVTEDHMDRYETFADYAKSKQRVYHRAEVAVCNKEDALTFCDNQQSKKLFFTSDTPNENEFGLRIIENEKYLALGAENLMPVSQLPVAGKHYQSNALAALAIGYAYGLPMAAMLSALKTFKGLPHRCEFVAEKNGVKWYNDSKGTNVGASLAAIEGIGSDISGKIILIAGGVGKNADFAPLLPAIKNYCRHIVLIGEAADELAQLLDTHLPYTFAANMESAVQQSSQAAKNQDCVLLSPACASLDMFKNFAHRGEVFVSEVRNHIGIVA